MNTASMIFTEKVQRKRERIFLIERALIFQKGKANHFPRSKYERFLIFKSLFKRDVIYIDFENIIDSEKTFKDYCSTHPRFAAKPVLGTKGKGVQILNGADISSVQRLNEQVGEACLLEEVIHQGEEMAIFHPQSVNTLRLVTALSGEGKFTPIFALVRFGCGTNIVDNVGSGGIAALVDIATGCICTNAIQNNGNLDGKQYKSHPDTGVIFCGYQLPAWKEVIEFAEQGHRMFPEQQLIGWDFAWTSDRGWDTVEVNPSPAFGTYQILSEQGIRPKLIEAGIL